ncbi:MAG TPA: tetratricopeptide repeat protein [Longimicrobiales bacterium]
MGLLQELQRRKVVRTTAAYLVAAFVAAQVTQLLVDALDLPSWILKVVVVLEIVAIPLVVGLAWAFDISRAGVHVTDANADERAPFPWRRLTAPAAVSLVLLVAAGFYIVRAVMTPTTISTLAVLPFENTGGDTADDYFSDGMRDELAVALARLPALRIAGRTSSYMFKDRAAPAEEIGRALDVNALIAGTVRRAGGRLRVTAQLVGTRDGKVMWDSVFESSSSDVFGVQDEFTRAIVAALWPTLSGGGGDDVTIDTKRGTMDTEAYELYLKGRYHWLERGEANLHRAIDYYRQAIARDPRFARAHAGLSLAYGVLPSYVPRREEWRVAQEASARRAVALDSTLTDGRLALGLLDDQDLKLADAEAEYRAALALEPGNASVHHALGFTLFAMGRTEEGLDHLQRATRIDPLAKSAGTAYAAALTFARRFDEAVAEARRILAIDSTFQLGLLVLGFAHAFDGKPDSAVLTLEQARARYPDARSSDALLVFAYAASGRYADARRLRDELHARTNPPDMANAAFADLVLGDPEPLVQLLTTVGGQREWYQTSLGFGCNPMLDPLWSDARFRNAMRELGTEPCALAKPWPAALQRTQ